MEIKAQSTFDNTKYATCMVTVNSLKIYQTKRTFILDQEGNFPEDLEFSDKTETEIGQLEWMYLGGLGLPISQLINGWKSMCTDLFANWPLEDVILDMIDHFVSGTGSTYSNPTLTQKAMEHPSTQTYINSVKVEINSLLSQYDGDINALQYYAPTRESHPLVMRMIAAQITAPVFNTPDDRGNGLQICVNDTWGNIIEVKSYSLNGSVYSGTLHFTIYDHFGLDTFDVEEYGYLAGFRGWYILQHLNTYNGQYKPFVTLMEFDVPFSGTIS